MKNQNIFLTRSVIFASLIRREPSRVSTSSTRIIKVSPRCGTRKNYLFEVADQDDIFCYVAACKCKSFSVARPTEIPYDARFEICNRRGVFAV